MKITISLKNIVFFKIFIQKLKHHSIFLTAVHHTKKEVNYSLIVVILICNMSDSRSTSTVVVVHRVQY